MQPINFLGLEANPALSRVPKKRIFIPSRVAKRAATRYKSSPTGCHISTYSVGSHGYAQIGWAEDGTSHVTLAHRAAWVYAHEEQIPTGMTIDHICNTPKCVNSDHLRLLTNFENARRTSGRDWEIGTCANGHPNTRLKLFGAGTDWQRWRCLDCHKAIRAQVNERRRRQRAADRAHR